MRNLSLFITAAALLVFVQGCSLKHAVGYTNNELVWRQAFGDMKTELSLSAKMQNSFADDTTEVYGLYRSEETGTETADLSVGLGFYYSLFKNDIFDISAGLKYRNYFRLAYEYNYYFENYGNVRRYHYDETLEFDFMYSNRVSIMLPEAEIKCPFMENLKFTFSVELLYIAWRYDAGRYDYNFWQDVATYSTYTEGDSSSVAAPGKVNNFRGGSDIFSLGGITAGILYYF